ncbi:hypothetical protein D3C77_259960 [compost metagenome]
MDDLVDIGDGDGQTDQDVAAIARLGQLELDPANDHFLAELEEELQQLAQAHLLGPPVVQRQHVDAERGLQRRIAIELIQDHVARGVALQLDDDAHALAVRLVADIGDAFQAFLAHHFGDALDQGLLVHLIGQFGDDDGVAILADFLHRSLAAHDDRAAPLAQRIARRRAAHDLAARGEVRPRHDVQQGVVRHVRIVQQGDRGVDHFAQVVRRDVGRHADGDAARAVDQQVRNPRRQDDGLQFLLVIVRLEIDRVLVDVGQQGHRRRGHLGLGVTHGGRHIAVDRAEVALAVDQHQPHGEVLGHADQGHVDRGVAVRVEPAQHVADHAGALRIRPLGRHVQVVHRIKDAPMHRLQTVARVRQGPADDHAHGVVEVGALQLILDGDGRNIARRRRGGVLVAVVGQGNQALNGRNRNVIRCSGF